MNNWAQQRLKPIAFVSGFNKKRSLKNNIKKKYKHQRKANGHWS